jgi:hypothetical protein
MRSGATSCAATSATRRTRRTRFGRARRGAGVTAGHCAAAGEHSLGPSVASSCARWRSFAGRRTAHGAPLAAGAAHVAGHAPGLPTHASGTGVTLPTPTDLPRAYKPAPAVPRAHALPPELPPSAIGAARCEPHSSRHPHSPKRLGFSLCTTKPPRAAY